MIQSKKKKEKIDSELSDIRILLNDESNGFKKQLSQKQVEKKK